MTNVFRVLYLGFVIKVEWTEIVLLFFRRNEGVHFSWLLPAVALRLLGLVIEVLDLGHAVALGVVDEGLLGRRPVLRQRLGCLLVVLHAGHGIIPFGRWFRTSFKKKGWDPLLQADGRAGACGGEQGVPSQDAIIPRWMGEFTIPSSMPSTPLAWVL